MCLQNSQNLEALSAEFDAVNLTLAFEKCEAYLTPITSHSSALKGEPGLRQKAALSWFKGKKSKTFVESICDLTKVFCL